MSTQEATRRPHRAGIDEPLLLGAHAARTCSVKTQNAFDPTVELQPGPIDDALAELFDGGAEFEDEVLARLVGTPVLTVVDVRGVGGRDQARRTTADAVRAGADAVVAAALPPDPLGHRVGVVDVLVRGADRADGRPGYHPVEVKWHRVTERRRRPLEASPAALMVSSLTRPSPLQAAELPGSGFRFSSREHDLVQLAHYWRLLEAAGWSAPSALAGVVGTDRPDGSPVVVWTDLAVPAVRTFSRSAAEGWALRSPLQRYDHEHAFRVDVAQRARRQTGDVAVDPPRLVHPIVVPECGRCPWWEHCWAQLAPDDISVRIDKGALDPREISTLRSRGIVSLIDLAGADLDALLPGYLPEVTHRHGSESRLRVAQHRATLLLADRSLERVSDGVIDVPGAVLEIDFDIETSPDGRVYLWGFAVNDTRDGSQRYHHLSRFADLSSEAEVALARSALLWLRQTVTDSPAVVYHYSGFEVAKITELAERSGDPVLAWAASYAQTRFVDLLGVVKEHFFGVHGLGLKQVATAGAGFTWRDDDPGGLNSQHWFVDAVHGDRPEQRLASQQRVLDYNEDDVRATATVRRWLRDQPAPPASGEPLTPAARPSGDSASGAGCGR